MSRSGYSYDCDGWALIRWRGAVASAIRGKRGQAFLRELLDALDAMPEKRLITNSFGKPGAHCTLGVIGEARGVALPETADDDWDLESRKAARDTLNIPDALAAEIMFHNDEPDFWRDGPETPGHRWSRMRAWVAAQIKGEPE